MATKKEQEEALFGSNLEGEGEAVEATDEAEAEVKPKPKPKPRSTRQTKPKGTTRIILEESDDIPPTGLFISLNGRGYMIKPGEEVDVPDPLIEILDHAVMETPSVDPSTRRVIGYKKRMRYPYRRMG